jgi:hypothetical protein
MFWREFQSTVQKPAREQGRIAQGWMNRPCLRAGFRIFILQLFGAAVVSNRVE